ncbi:xylosyltransferase 1-like [Sycon ciliatum]|uniref:xylosyltransferase 1-like n=1 Tax=Sycon ciliatum TaxID=27933 RepID=UPI0020AD50BA|eukprot:scpid26149/ scgid20327/ Xylosyltransferase 1; Peptide O-xylosyltransferase 1; Xylosyltransferase I
MWLRKDTKELDELRFYTMNFPRQSPSSTWVRHNQKMAMKCSTGKVILVLLSVIVVVQFGLQLRISYLEGGFARGVIHAEGDSNVRFRLEKIPDLIGKFKRQVDEPYVIARPPPKPREPPPETIVLPFIPHVPACNITVKEALSALSRAKTEDCKDQLRRVSCAHQLQQLYWTNFTRTCPVHDNPAISANMSLPKLHPDIPRVRILFMITVHGRAVRQVYRVLKAIYHVNHYYYIHVDARSHYMLAEMNKLAAKFDNVRVTPWRLATIWGGASLLQMLLRAMEDADAMTDWNWDYFINLSESDFPFKNFTYIVDYMTAWRKHNFLRAHGKTSPRFIHKQGLDQTFFECEHHMWRIGPRKLPEGIHIDGGSDWIMLNRDYVHYLVASTDAVALGLKHMFSYTLLPAESFFHTLLRNSPMCQTMVKNNLRLANWKRSLGCRCQYKAIVDWCGCSPNDFLSEDFKKIQGLQDKLFGRKFEAVVNQDIINKLDFWLFGAYPAGTPALDAYWENMYNSEDFGESYSDVQMTLYRSVARLLRAKLSGCIAANDQANIQDVHLYRENDVFKAIIVKIRYGNSEDSPVFEAFVVPAVKATKSVDNPAVPRFKSISVGTKFDKKEYVYRNYAGIIGVQSQVVFVVRYTTGQSLKLKVVFTSPSGKKQKVQHIDTNKDWSIADLPVDFQLSEEPGLWRADVEVLKPTAASLGSVHFVLFPRELEGNKEIVDAAGVQRAGLGPYVVLKDDMDVQQQLQDYVDSVTRQAWTISSHCAVSGSSRLCPSVSSCSKTSWSTLSPDPKSDLPDIKANGRIR